MESTDQAEEVDLGRKHERGGRDFKEIDDDGGR